MRPAYLYLLAAAPLALAPLPALGAGPPPEFSACAACHSTSKDSAHGIGPNLRGVVGSKAGAAAGFKYSAAMRRSGLTWAAADLDAFLAAPRKVIPNTTMSYLGLRDPLKRKRIISYLETLK